MERRPNCSASLRLKDAVIAVRITTRPITAATRPGWRDILLREAIKRQNPTRKASERLNPSRSCRIPKHDLPQETPPPDWPSASHSQRKGVGCKEGLLQPGLTPQILG